MLGQTQANGTSLDGQHRQIGPNGLFLCHLTMTVPLVHVWIKAAKGVEIAQDGRTNLGIDD